MAWVDVTEQIDSILTQPQGAGGGQSNAFGNQMGTSGLDASQAMIGRDKTGKPVYDPIKVELLKKQVAAIGKGDTKSADLQAEVNQSALTAQYNLNLSSEALYDYSKLLARAWREGGAGNWAKEKATYFAREGLPIGDAKQYKASGALPGKLVEIVSKTFPMLTQQIGKEGSVRLIESIFSKLGGSYPNAKTPPEMAPDQIYQSLLSMYRINRALQNMDLKEFDLTDKNAKEKFVNRIVVETKNIELDEEESAVFEQFAEKVLSPVKAQLELDRRTKLKKGKK